MGPNPVIPMILLSIFVFLLDLYLFRGLKILISSCQKKTKKIVFRIFWLIPILAFSLILVFLFFRSNLFTGKNFYHFYYLTGILLLIYVPKIIVIDFLIIQDFIRLISFLVLKIFKSKLKSNSFFHKLKETKIFIKTGVIISVIPFLAFIYGMTIGKMDYKIRKVELYSEKLPKQFDGLKIVQLSDIHLGSLIYEKNNIKNIINVINDLKPDIICFTGDFVNNNSSEFEGWIEIFNKLKAKTGMYSILGNHDYGDYWRWNSQEEKIQNLELMKKYQKDIGFNLLLNDAVIIEKDSQKIAIIGVENWGNPPFSQYGKLDKALKKTDSIPFKILLSHDPRHFMAQVYKKTDIFLTLSGHTHGMQMGLECGDWRWSPVKYTYQHWGGLYKEGNQYIYVNIGLGYIGFPGRVGASPEITLIELKSKSEKPVL